MFWEVCRVHLYVVSFKLRQKRIFFLSENISVLSWYWTARGRGLSPLIFSDSVFFSVFFFTLVTQICHDPLRVLGLAILFI